MEQAAVWYYLKVMKNSTRNTGGMAAFGKCGDTGMKKYAMPIIMLIVFETIAITLWLTKDNLFYLFNFSYIGMSISLGIFLFIKQYRHARRIVQLLSPEAG